MKKIALLFLFAFAGAYAQADKVKFTAKIENRNSDSLVIASKKLMKVIRADKKGVFTDAFAVEPGIYQLYDGKEVAMVYLKNGNDLSMTMNAKMFDETISFKGSGAKENNFLAKRALMNEALTNMVYEDKVTDINAYRKNVNDNQEKLETALNDNELDETFRTMMAGQLKAESQQFTSMAEQAFKVQKLKGTLSPSFAYENFKGGTTGLEEFKGKYVYIDVWATWCGPCRQEIPYLQKVEEKYHGKDIVFASISVDTKKDYEKWKKMVGDKALGGVQLIADNDWKSEFVTAYSINSIPRFILIGPDGKVIDADAKRPSDPELQAQLDKLVK
jgi:thiol-disulfide isomerase/thioredoxin